MDRHAVDVIGWRQVRRTNERRPAGERVRPSPAVSRKRANRRGRSFVAFTLIELLVVIAIIAILAAMLMRRR